MFKPLLEKLVERMEGKALGAVLMDKEGICVEKFQNHNDGVDIETAAIGYSVVLKDIFKAADMVKAGKVSEVFIKSAHYTALIRVLDENYFAALFLKPDGNMGKGRFVLRNISLEIKKEL